MSWTLLLGLVLILGIMLLASISRRGELAHMAATLDDRERARRLGGAEPKLQHPTIDLSRCLGCATCVAVCPEQGVLEIVHGQAVVVNGARCEGISACERECPVGAINITLSGAEERTDIPALNAELEAVGTPGLFVAGELTAHALIKTAIEQGTRVGEHIAGRVALAQTASLVPASQSHAPMRVTSASPGTFELGSSFSSEAYTAHTNSQAVTDPDLRETAAEVLDLCILGAGPAGFACSLVAKREGLRFVTIDREATVGGTVAKYPRNKLVMTQPVELPLHGKLDRPTYGKEELVELWQRIAHEQQLPIQGGVSFLGLDQDADGIFTVHTDAGTRRARNVCVAIGRRGDPVKLGVQGEQLAKVTYGLMDATGYQDADILVVGGGDSAAEAALALAAQPGNRVTMSYRREGFFRMKATHEEQLRRAAEEGRMQLVFESEVISVEENSAHLSHQATAGTQTLTLANDYVFVLAGGTPPFDLLSASGISFDPALRPKPAAVGERGNGLARALAPAFCFALLSLAWALWHLDYYGLEGTERPVHAKHDMLRPSQGIGLWLGIASVALILANLAYLPRRSPRTRFNWGSLQSWMTSHIATGVLALVCVLLHAAMSPRDTAGGHAFISIVILLVTGAVGRYFYAFVPRATNGRELELSEVTASLGQLAEEFDAGFYKFRERVRGEVFGLIRASQWNSTLSGRILGVLSGQRRLRRTLQQLELDGRQEGVPEEVVQETIRLARAAHKSASMLAHYEDLRSLIGTWRYLHRWGALAMLLLVTVHVVLALVYSEGS
ncbi:MAG: thioredoxin reductase/Pyruvate/2-oxoacid:ferredoxin oxidoreductase delta subunit [Planctomycetota bacterium]